MVGLYDDRLSRIPAVQDGVRVRGSVRDLLERSREEQIDLIVIALPLRAISRISMILGQIGSAVADICLTTDFVGFRYRSSQISSIGSNPVVLIEERPLKDWRAAKKSAFDLVIGSLMLVVLSPFLALIALAIRLDSPGPILFRQPRLGFNNRLFTCYKFRSMHNGMRDLLGERQATRGDPRVTRLGKWLRALSVDELPQLLNVLQGDMSLVGPRRIRPTPRRRTNCSPMWSQNTLSATALSPGSQDGRKLTDGVAKRRLWSRSKTGSPAIWPTLRTGLCGLTSELWC